MVVRLRIPQPLVALLFLLLSGCTVRVYQPLAGFHRPVVVDPQMPNFVDTRLALHCIPGNGLSPGAAATLCQRVRTLFENQGALVESQLGFGPPDPLEPSAEPTPKEARPIQLTVELRARNVHEAYHPLSWVLSVATLTLLPGVWEATFAQDIVIRDQTGFLLVTDSLEGRLVSRFGVGIWAGNALANVWRDEPDKIRKDSASADLSADLYRQLSQVVFNARMHAVVLSDAASGE